MATPSKRARDGQVESADESIDDDTGNSASESDSDAMDDEEIMVDFEGFQPQPGDFHGMKRLLQQLFLKAHVNTGELAELIIAQNYIGSVVKQSEPPEDDSMDDDIFGLTTIINITNDKKSECVDHMKNLVLSKSKKFGDPDDQMKLNDLLNTEQGHCVGMLFNERFINLPPQLSLPLFTSLRKDLQTAISKQRPFNFSHLLLITKTHKETGQQEGDTKDSKKHCTTTLIDSESGLLFTNPEDELFYNEAVIKFSYPVSEESDGGLTGKWSCDDTVLKPLRTVIILPVSHLETVLHNMASQFS